MIYLDHAATTKPFDDVFDVMREVAINTFGNPSSLHDEGIKARKLMNQTRKRLASLLNAHHKQLIFTGSGTEAINMVLQGVAKMHPKQTIVSLTTEHHAVMHTLEHLQASGHSVIFLPVDDKGYVSYDALKEALMTHEVALVSLLYTNNETGVKQDMEPLIKLCHSAKARVHLDMVQVPLHEAIDLESLNVDFASFSAHKFHGPRGVGLAYIKDSDAFEKLLFGGKQEFDLRAGTENLPAMVGTLKALETVESYRDEWESTIKSRAQFFIQCLNARPIDYRLNGPSLHERRHAGTLNIGFKDVDAQQLSFYLNQQGIYVSLGSACSSSNIEPSHVLKAMNVPKDYLYGSIRFSFGPELTEKDVLRVVDVIEAYLTKTTQA